MKYQIEGTTQQQQQFERVTADLPVTTSRYKQALIDAGWTSDKPYHEATDIVFDVMCDEVRTVHGDIDETMVDPFDVLYERAHAEVRKWDGVL